MAPLPWSFESLAGDALRASCRAVDIGTGGGERLSRVIGSAGDRIFATEDYAANVPVARARLEPLGVRLIASTSSRLPFRDSSFDLVLNSRAGFYASEVARVLMPAGRVLTEQMDRGISVEIRQSFGLPVSAESDHAAELVARCEKAGLRIERLETADRECSFNDIGAIVYYLRALPWIVPGFTVERYIEPLHELQHRLECEGKITFPRRLNLLIARRAA